MQVDRIEREGAVIPGKTYVNEFGIGAVEMTVQPDAVLSPWYSTDEKSKGAVPPVLCTPAHLSMVAATSRVLTAEERSCHDHSCLVSHVISVHLLQRLALLHFVYQFSPASIGVK